jgi:hypothetical protein
MIGTFVDMVLRDTSNLETIIENIKRESTKWKFTKNNTSMLFLPLSYQTNQSEV